MIDLKMATREITLTKKWLQKHKFSKDLQKIFDYWTYDELINVDITYYSFIENKEISSIEISRFLYRLNYLKENHQDYYDDDSFNDTYSVSSEDNKDFCLTGSPQEKIENFLNSIEGVECQKFFVDNQKSVFYKGKLIFYITEEGFIKTPIKSKCTHEIWERHKILFNSASQWGFQKVPRSKYRLFYDYKNKTLDDINKIVDFIKP